jgi:fructokinase
MPLKEDLEKALGQKISMENDANCFAMAESMIGVAKEFGVVFGVIMGTGVGGGIVIDKKIHHGRTNIAGEWGHHTLHQNGNDCYCGKLGCVETYISGPSLEKRWKELTGKSQSIPEIIQNLESPNAKKWKNEFLENFGFGLANVIDILDPDAIVLGGGLSNIDFLYTEGKDSVYEKVFSDLVDTPILKNKLGDSAGVFGAALLQDLV